MEASSSPLYFCNDGSEVSLLSVPDLESLEEITDGDVQELLQLVSSHTRDRAAPPRHHANPLTSSEGHSIATVGGTSTALPRRNSAHQESARASTATDSSFLPTLPVTSHNQSKQAPQTSTRRTAAAGTGFFPPASSSYPQLTHVSDTAVLDAEQRRWGSQLVQECWMHQELHNVRWNEQRLLKHGAAYRPRAIASRTAVKMTHTKSLCIALNVDTAIIENAGESQVEEDGEDGAAENPRMPSMSSPEAEAWAPLLMWRSPALTPGDASTVLTQLSECLSEQYEGLAPRPLPTSCCANARPSDLVQTLSDARKDAGDAKVIFHYLARGVPPPRGGNIYLMNNASAASGYAGPPYSKLSLDTFRSRVGFPLVFIADCAEAREILNYYIRMCEEQHQQRYFTSSREYQLKSSRQVSAAELDSLADGPGGAVSGSFDRVGSGGDLNASDNLRRGRGGGGLDGASLSPCAVLQDFFFIGASGSSTMGSSPGAGGGGLRDRSGNGGGGGGTGYDDASMSSSNVSRGGFPGAGGGNGAGAGAGITDAGVLRHHVLLPSDILTSCLTTPLRMAVLWFIAERPDLQELHPLLLRLFPGALSDKKTPLGQLHWYLQSIIECIAWSALSLPDYSRLFREDVYVAPLFRGYVLAERIVVGGLGGCLSVYPPLAPTHSHTLWRTWDNLVERACVSVLRAVHPAPPRCASVLEFRGWLDEQVTAWKYTRQDLLALTSTHTGAPSTSGAADGRPSGLPATPDETAVIMPSLLTESLRGMQAQLDGITQQSFERPRVFFAEIIGLQLPSSPSAAVRDSGRSWESGSGDEREGGARTRRPSPPSLSKRRGDAAATQRGQSQPLLREVAIHYSNALRSSYLAQTQLAAGVAVQEVARGGVTPSASTVSMGKLLGGSAGVEGGRRASPREPQRGIPAGREAGANARGMPSRSDSRATLPTGRYQRTSQANLAGLSGATSSTASAAAGGNTRNGGAGASALTTPTSNVAAAVAARMEAHRTSSRLSSRQAEYVTNVFANSSSAFQAASFQYTAELSTGRGGSDVLLGSPASPLSVAAAAPPPPQHTFPFIDRMPLLLQALLVAAHREKATELLCRLVDCGPAAVLQCAEANIYRFVLDRYWNRPDLRFLMPSTLFIYCKSCYADPELIGSAKQCDLAVKACAEILQSPVDVPPLAPATGAGGEDAPGAWQNTMLGPYASPYGQRMLAAALLTLIALHSDGGREACHRHGCFQLCCQLLHNAREDAPLLLMSSSHEPPPTGTSWASPAPSMPPIPRAPSNTLNSNASFLSPSQAQSRAANAARPASIAASVGEPLPPPPASIATTYHVTLLTLFVSLLCNWKASAAAEDEEVEGQEGDEAALSPPLDGVVHALSPTTPQVLAAGLRIASEALLNFSYSDTSILRGAALRCFMMVLISPAPSQVSRNHFVGVGLRIIEGETLHRCELNTDLRLEEMGMAYTTFRWLLDQLREDVPIEEIGQYVAVWVYKWFKLTAQGKMLAAPPGALGGGGNGAAARGSPASTQGQRASQLSSSYQPSARTQWMPPVSMSYRGSSVVTPGSVYSHRGSNVLVPAARSVYGAAMHEAAGGGVVGSFVGTLGSGLRQHLTRQDHRRLQSCLPPLSNLVRLFFEHTQDACPYIRTYARKVVTEEFGFLHQSWYDDYAANELHISPRDEDYGGYHNHHISSSRPSHRHRSYNARLDAHAVAETARGGGASKRQSADPLTASSVDGGGDLTTYLPLRDMLNAGAVFDELQAGGGAATGPVQRGGGDAASVLVSTSPMMAAEMEEMADPQPAVLRRFIGRLLRVASTNGPDASDSPSSFPRASSRHRLDAGGVHDADDDGEAPAGDFPPSGSDVEGEGGYADRRGGPHRRGSLHRRGGTSGDHRRREEEGEERHPSTYSLDDVAASETEGEFGGTLLDSETLALHPLWAMDSTSMTNFAYGALSFLERFMLEKMDDSDPRHPMNLEKENALHHYFQRVERNIRAFAQDETTTTAAAAVEKLRMPAASILAASGAEGVNETRAGSRALTGAENAPPPPHFQCLGEGDIGQAGVPGYGHRCGGRARRSGFARRAPRSGRHIDSAGKNTRVSGSVDVVLFHPSEPLVITSTTGGLLSVWSYDHLGLPTTGDSDAAERAHGGDEEEEEDGDADDASDAAAAEPTHSRQRSAADGTGGNGTKPRRRLHAKAQFFLRDVVGRSRSDLCAVAQPRFMYDRFNPNGEAARPRGAVGLHPRRQQRGGADGRHGAREREAARYAGNFHRRDGVAGGGGGSRVGAWVDRAEAANALAALPSSYQQGHPHFYHGVGDLHLVDAAQRPLICAVRRFGAVEVFSHFTDRQRVRRVITFETARFGQHEGVDRCVSSYQSCTGLLYVSNGEGGVSAWDLGNEQRLATVGTLAGADAASVVGAGSISALEANPCTPYEYLVGSYGKQVCLFDLRDGGGAAARLGYAHPSAQFSFASASPISRHGSPLSPLCVRVSYSRRYPDAVVAGYACGTVAVWDRRYSKQPSLLFGAALSGLATREGGAAAHGFGGSSLPAEGGASTVIRQLDVHACSKRFLTLATTPTTLQLMQPRHCDGGGDGGFGSDSPLSCNFGTSCAVETYDLARRAADGGDAVEQSGSEPGAACFHDFSPVLCVGAGGSVRLYGTAHLSTMATYMDVNLA